MILVTGSSGLVGRHLCARLEAEGIAIRRFDLREIPSQDIRDPVALAGALRNVSGVVHLAAISRVVWAENDPDLCRATNVEALRALAASCLDGARPWLIFASSREVYGNPTRLPVREEDALMPVNIYGRSKRDGERIVETARESGLAANICRFSNVYGCPYDHKDRVAMAFAAVAARGGVMSVEGGSNTFDFTAIEDVVDGLWRLIHATIGGELLPPIHFVSGQGTTLRELADIAAARARRDVRIVEASPRNFDVSNFVGDPARAQALLGWKAQAGLADRISRLIADLADGDVASDSGDWMRLAKAGVAARNREPVNDPR
jgi:UDP-glucose 4-epimerase